MGKFKPIFESLSEAAVRGARHADVKLPQLAKNHADQLGACQMVCVRGGSPYERKHHIGDRQAGA